MVDVGTGLAALGTAEVSKDALQRLLGPTADYIGEGVRAWTEKRVSNVQRMFASAHGRLGDNPGPGSVPPRVLGILLEQAQFADDNLMTEYLGGVLASSRTELGRDDRAVTVAKRVASLSSYAVRTHYLVYAAARSHEVGSRPEIWRTKDRARKRSLVYLSTAEYWDAMEFSPPELTDYGSIVADTLMTLESNDVCGPRWGTGEPRFLREQTKTRARFPGHGIVYELTQQGVALFCAAHGVHGDPFTAYVSRNETFRLDGAPKLPLVTPVAKLPTLAKPTPPRYPTP
jgi:hypothetical protein